MANRQQLQLLKRNVKDWNQWRKDNPKTRINLFGARLTKAELFKVNLSEANLSVARLWKANLSEANLSGADLSGTDFIEANLSRANFSGANLTEIDFSGANLTEANFSETNLTGVDFSKANLTGVDFSGVNLSGANFTEARLVGAKLIGAQLIGAQLVRTHLDSSNLHLADLSEANLSEATLTGTCLIGAELIRADLSNANFFRANLAGADFLEANFHVADFSEANLSKANLSSVNLSTANLSKANLSEATLCETLWQLTVLIGAVFKSSDLTGACIQNWSINVETDFTDVICDYIFLKWDEKNQASIERRPSDPNRNFASGDFERFIRQSLETVALIFGEGIDWNAFLQSFQGLQLDSEVGELSIAGIKKNRDGSFVVQVDVPADADKAAIEKDFWNRYQPLLEAKDQQIKLLQGQLEFSQDQVNRERQNAANLITIVQTMAEKQQGTTYNINAENIGIAGGHTTAESGSIIAGQFNEAEKQNLQQAAAEIQALLKQLETEYGSDTMSEKMTVATEVIKEIEQNQTLAQRVIAAFKAGGMSPLDSYLDTPAASFVISAIQSWYETSQKSE